MLKYILNNKFIILNYSLLIAGGLWYLFGYRELISLLAVPFLIYLTLVCFGVNYKKTNQKIKLLLYTLSILISTFFIEYLGVKSGMIFGEYSYGKVLLPQLWNIPLFIGFAWVLVLYPSVSIVEKYFPDKNIIIKAVLTALLMVIFDAFMEPAAVKLGYWYWQGGGLIQVNNYIAWFIVSFVISLFGYRISVLNRLYSKYTFHLYFAQIVYFALVHLN